MSVRSQQSRATYVAYRFYRAIDRVLHADSGGEKMRANRWASAWSTAYFARTDRRNASTADLYAEQFERRCPGEVLPLVVAGVLHHLF
jgi:hypothetical protein